MLELLKDATKEPGARQLRDEFESYLDKRRQVLLIELAFIEDLRGIERTKPPKGKRQA